MSMAGFSWIELITSLCKFERMHPNKRLSLTVGYDEVDVRNTVKAARGKWDGRQKVWKLAYKQVVALGLIDRVVSEGNDKEVG